jgi:hypothetical protein
MNSLKIDHALITEKMLNPESLIALLAINVSLKTHLNRASILLD